nr:IscS subfamily cysteine desulfurase [Priestia megaterium]
MKYFDYAATTPIDPEVLAIYQETALSYWGNTSSLHDQGTKAKGLLESCRDKLASILHVSSDGIYFTSGGTEANHIAIITLALSRQDRGKHIITTMAEHSSVFSSTAYLRKAGFKITEIPFLQNGQLDFYALTDAIQNDTILISVGHANSEIGSIQPIEAISKQVRGQNILLHSDCVQSFGKIDIASISPFVDAMSLSSHKIYGPKGVGAVFIRPEYRVTGIFPNETHERGIRGGTVNTPGIAAFVAAALKLTNKDWKKMYQLRTTFFEHLGSNWEKRFTIIESPSDVQLPHVIGLTVNGREGQWVMLECNRRGFHISTGSACHQELQSPARTIIAMGVMEEKQREFIRISFGQDTTLDDVIQLAQLLRKLAK